MKIILWQDEIKQNISFLRLLGLMPTDGKFKKTDPYTYLTIFVILCSTVHVSLQACYVLSIYSNLELATDSLFFCLPSCLAVFKEIVLVKKSKMVRRLLQDLDEDILQPRSSRQVALIRPDIQLWKIIHRWLMVVCSACLVLFCSLPILSGSVKKFELPNSACYPYEIQKPLPYVLTYAFQTVATFLVAYSSYNVDMLISAVMMFIGVQCDILCDNLRNLGLESNDFGKSLEECVVHHKMTLRLAERCTEFSNFIVLAQFFISVTCLALSLFRLALAPLFDFEFYFYMCCVTTFIVEAFAYCWFGDKIQTKSENITYALFESVWITQSLADKNSMMIFAERAQIPIRLSTFKLFYLTLETFVKILRSGMSYFTILRQFSDSD